MPNINAPVTGIPAAAVVDIILRYPLQQLDAQGLPAPEYHIRSTDGGATYVDLATNALPDVPASGPSNPYPTDPVEVQLTVTHAGRSRTNTMYVLPVQIDGVFNLSKPITPVGWITPTTLGDIIASLEAGTTDLLGLRADVEAGLVDLSAGLAAVPEALADITQSTTLSTLTRNMIIEASAQNAMPSVQNESDLAGSNITQLTDTMVRSTGEIWRKGVDTIWRKQAPGLIGPQAVTNSVGSGNIDPGVSLVVDFETDTGITLFPGATIDTTRAFHGTRSVKLTVGTTGSSRVRFSMPTKADWSNHALRLRLWTDDANAPAFNNITMRCIGAGLRIFDHQHGAKPLPGRWTSYTFLAAYGAASNVTPANMAAVDYIEIELNYAAAAVPSGGSVWIDWVEAYEQPEMPMAVIISDDANDDSYTTMIPYMEQFGMRLSIPTISSYTDSGIGANGPTMTWDQLLEVQGRGHEVTCHSRLHMNLKSALTTQDYPLSLIADEMTGGRADLMRRGIALSGLNHWVYPGGGETPDTYDYVKRHFKSARLVGGSSVVAARGQDMHRLSSAYVLNNAPASSILNLIQRVSKYGGVMLITFHRVLPDGVTPQKVEDVNFTYFKGIIDALMTNDVPVVTMEEFVSGSYQKVLNGRYRDRLTGDHRRTSVRNGVMVTDYVPPVVIPGTNPVLVMPAGAAAAYDFRPGSSATELTDISGNFRHGVVPAAFQWRDAPQRIIATDATKQVDLPLTFQLGGQAEFTIAAMVYISDRTATRTIYQENTATVTNKVLLRVSSSGNPGMVLKDDANASSTYDHGLVVPQGAWTLLVMSVSAANARVTCWVRGGVTGKNIYPKGGQTVITPGPAAPNARKLIPATGIEIGLHRTYLREFTDAEVDAMWAVVKAQYGY
ncbi:polysaccharide deacetylase family protein [Deinococcus aquatilis]|uniref:polysaccharide deacetylase family protein n=1 Tax=Deinococcus aquatilis TaxID=519440 RepID=UPI000361D6B8|nr:polysaccharide deacetylase family protein [Deinococcus aquatilis]